MWCLPGIIIRIICCRSLISDRAALPFTAVCLPGVLTAYIMCRIKKIPFLQFANLAAPGLLVGQILGRWGNFFNREAFGQYTDGLFAMELPLNAVRSMDDITQEMLVHARVADGVTYVQVHPTFLYESLWNLALLIFILAMTKHKKFHGEFFYFYLFFYGLGRFWIEGLRTDQLKMWVTSFRYHRHWHWF